VEKHGVSPRGVHWISQQTQYKRFYILTLFFKDEIKNSSIIDAGCGFAEYYNYLVDKRLRPKSYKGYDIEDIMIQKAKRRFPALDLEQKDILKDELEVADYYICSGAMNILTKEEMFEFINRCFTASKKGFAFNFLKKDSFNKVSASEILSHCKHLSKQIYIKDNYLENDISIYLKKHYLTN